MALCATCDCNSGMTNTGAGCSAIMRDAYNLIFVPLYANDGTQNHIDLTATLNQTFFDDLVNETDGSKRFYPLATQDGLKDVESVRADPVYQTATDASQQKVRDGIKPFKGYIRGIYATPTYAGKLNNINCQAQLGVYKIDRGKNLVGIVSSDRTKMYPIAIDPQSFNAKFIEATPDKNNAEIEIMFNFAIQALDKDLKMISCNEFTNYDIQTIQGLIDVYAEYSSITVNGFGLKLYTDWGTIINPLLDQGRVTGDFISSATSTVNKVRRTNNTAADVTVTVVESATSPGNYTVTFGTAQTSGDIIQVKIKKNGRDYSEVLTALVTIP